MKKLIAFLAAAAALALAGCPKDPPTPQPSLEPGTAVPGAYCRTEGAKRLTETGATATCAYGPDGGGSGQRLEWTLDGSK